MDLVFGQVHSIALRNNSYVRRRLGRSKREVHITFSRTISLQMQWRYTWERPVDIWLKQTAFEGVHVHANMEGDVLGARPQSIHTIRLKLSC